MTIAAIAITVLALAFVAFVWLVAQGMRGEL